VASSGLPSFSLQQISQDFAPSFLSRDLHLTFIQQQKEEISDGR
jgi:hypothetical protein